MNTRNISRIVLNLVIAAAILNGWWFVALPICIAGVWFYGNFIEIIIAGIAYDALFGMVPGMGIRGFVGTILAVVVYAALFLSKKMVRR